MSNKDSFDPNDDKSGAKKSPVGDPSSPPDPDVKKAAERSGAKGSAMNPGSPLGAGGHVGTAHTSDISGGPGGERGVRGTTANPASTTRPESRVSPTDAGAPGDARDVAGTGSSANTDKSEEKK